MSIETLEDIVNEVMDKLGVYGSCNEFEGDTACTEQKPCRCCQASGLNDRIRRAIEIEQRLQRGAT